MKEVKRVFTVDGKPFFPIGGEANNSAGYDKNQSEAAFKAVKLLHGNNLLIPVYWDKVEPEEGKFDFTTVDSLLSSARRYGIKLILLWFATWKNGNMDYTPAWVKTDPKRFKRVLCPTGKDVWVLSSHCEANLKADKKAFLAFCKYLKEQDSVERTVIGLQVENEPGIIGSDRDYGPEAQAEFDSPVPAKLLSAMKAAGKGRIYDIWQKSGGKKSGAWPEIFGSEAGELMTAWSIANYIDGIVEAGKAIYNLPMFINVWMMEQNWWPMAGEAYPSGGAVTKTLDIYKWFTPHVDLIAPDIKPQDTDMYEAMCQTYSRDDNPLFLPETPPSLGLYSAVANYNLIGYHRMGGLETIVADDGTVRPEARIGVETIRVVASVLPLLLKYQGTGKIHAVMQKEFMESQYLDLDGYMGLVQFGAPNRARDLPPDPNRGRGLVIQASRNEFYLVGVNYRLLLRAKPSTEKMQLPLLVADWTPKLLGHTVSVDEGHFDRNDKFVVDRTRNGDQVNRGLGVEADNGVLRVITCD
jgi:hypothetical protein